MFSLNDIAINPANDAGFNWSFGHFKIDFPILNQTYFADPQQKLGLTLEGNIDLAHYLEELNKYIIWLGDCRQVLEKFYQTFNQTVLERNHHGFLPQDWYDQLTVINGTVIITENGELRAGFTVVDSLAAYQVLVIEFKGYEISKMYYEG